LVFKIDSVLGDKAVPTYDDLAELKFCRLCLIEGLRLYPEPPVLIRRALDGDELPKGAAGFNTHIARELLVGSVMIFLFVGGSVACYIHTCTPTH
jgi:hypothetical protein